MPGKFVDTILDATNGELLSASDFECMEEIYLSSLPAAVYNTEPAGYWNVSPFDNGKYYVKRNLEEGITPDTSILVPKIKGLFIRELAIAWVLPGLYRGADYVVAIYKNKRSTSPYPYPVQLYWKMKAAELYKGLVDELLPLFKEEDREQVKSRLLAGTVGDCIRRLTYTFATGISKDIEFCKDRFGLTNVPQLKIDNWVEWSNLLDAWIAEANVYRKEQQLYRHNKDLKNIKDGLYNKVTWDHPDDKRSLSQWRIWPISEEVKSFLQEREAALNPAPTPYETVSVKVHPATMMFIHEAQKVSQLAGCLHVGETTANTEERVRLLDKLEGYKPKFVSPKAAKPNSIDADIALQEKRLMQCAEQVSQQSVEELLQLTKDATKLLSMVYMRYKNSLNAKDEPSYFGWFKPASLTDKESYYEVFAFYMENIFHKCLVPLLRLTTSEPALYEVALRDAIGTSSALVEFSHDIEACDTPTLQKASRQLAEIQSLHEPYDAFHVNDGFNNGLRHRLVRG